MAGVARNAAIEAASAGRSNRPSNRKTASSGPSPSHFSYDAITRRAWPPCCASAVNASISRRRRTSPPKLRSDTRLVRSAPTNGRRIPPPPAPIRRLRPQHPTCATTAPQPPAQLVQVVAQRGVLVIFKLRNRHTSRDDAQAWLPRRQLAQQRLHGFPLSTGPRSAQARWVVVATVPVHPAPTKCVGRGSDGRAVRPCPMVSPLPDQDRRTSRAHR